MYQLKYSFQLFCYYNQGFRVIIQTDVKYGTYVTNYQKV